jgi:hypothetical protein
MADKDSTFKDILYQLQIANEGLFDNISVLSKIEKLIDIGNMQSMAFQAAAQDGSKPEVVGGGNEEVVAGLNFLSDVALSSLKALERIDFASDITMQRIVEMTDAAKASSLQALENESEFRDRIDKLIQENAALLAEITLMRKDLEKQKKEKPEMSWATWAIAVGAALLGFVEGFIAELAIQAKALFTGLTKLLDFGEVFKKIKGSKFVATITEAFESIVLAGERLGSKMNALFEMFKRSDFGQKIVKAFESITEFGSRLGSKMNALFEMFKRSEFVTQIAEGFTKILEIVERFGSKVRALYQIIKRSALIGYITELFQGFTNLGRGISEAFEPVIKKFNLIKRVLSIGTESTSIVGKLINSFKGISSFFGEMKLVTAVMFRFGKAFGSFIGKLNVPFMVIMGIFDSITGFIDGFTKTEGNFIDKLLGGLRGGVKKFLDGLIGGIFNIMKSIVSWAAGALGFKDLEKMLDSFNFGDIIDKIIH